MEISNKVILHKNLELLVHRLLPEIKNISMMKVYKKSLNYG